MWCKYGNAYSSPHWLLSRPITSNHSPRCVPLLTCARLRGTITLSSPPAYTTT